MAPKAAPPPPPPPPPSEADPEPELPDGVYRKELSKEQLNGFYENAYKSHEDMIMFLADVLGLRDITYKAHNAIIVDYFSGFLLFAKEAGLSLQTTFHVWKLSHDMLDFIMEGSTFEEAERYFKKLILKLSIHQRKGDVPALTVLDCQKIAPFFTTTIFQHYTLLNYCFLHDHINWFKSEQVWVQTPLILPLKVASTQYELDADKAAQEAYETAIVVHQLREHLMFRAIEDIMTAEPVEVDLDGLSPDEYVKAKPETLDECIERACRHKIEEAKKLFHNNYQGRETKILLKLVELEVKAGIAATKLSVMKPQELLLLNHHQQPQEQSASN